MTVVDSEAFTILFEKNAIYSISEKNKFATYQPLIAGKQYSWAVVCGNDNNYKLNEVEINQLQRILQYLKLNIEDVAVFIINKTDILPYAYIHKLTGFKTLMCFGINRKNLQLNIETGNGYSLISFYNTRFFFSHGLFELTQDDSKKKQLKPVLDELTKH